MIRCQVCGREVATWQGQLPSSAAGFCKHDHHAQTVPSNPQLDRIEALLVKLVGLLEGKT